MKRIVLSLSFIISVVICGGLFAQNNDTKEAMLIEDSASQKTPDDAGEWENAIERFIGIWSLEKRIVDDNDDMKGHLGTFMVVHPDASYTIFVHCDDGALITSQGNFIIESSSEYVEVISHHVNKLLVGVANRIEYKLNPTYLDKTFWEESYIDGERVRKHVNEVWKRGVIPEDVTED